MEKIGARKGLTYVVTAAQTGSEILIDRIEDVPYLQETSFDIVPDIRQNPAGTVPEMGHEMPDCFLLRILNPSSASMVSMM